MTVEEDFKELLRLFNKHRVRYCIIGAFAVGFHAISRYTKDLDLLVEPEERNGERIVRALEEFGFGSLPLHPSDFCEAGRFIQLGYEPVRIDLVTAIQGVSFERVWRHKKRGAYGNERVYYRGSRTLRLRLRVLPRPPASRVPGLGRRHTPLHRQSRVKAQLRWAAKHSRRLCGVWWSLPLTLAVLASGRKQDLADLELLRKVRTPGKRSQ